MNKKKSKLNIKKLIESDKYNDFNYQLTEEDIKRILKSYRKHQKYLKKIFNKKRRRGMGWLISSLPFIKSIAVKAAMAAAKWLIRYGVKVSMTPSLLKYVNVTKKASGDYVLNIEVSEFQRAAYKTPTKIDNKFADLVEVAAETAWKLKKDLNS